MATLDDLFGNTSNGPKVPSAGQKLQNEGDTLVAVLVEEPTVEDETDFNTRKKKFMVQTEDEGWKPRLEGEFDADLNHFNLTKIVLVVETENGEKYKHHLSGDHKNALKEAMQDSQVPLIVGTTVAAKVLEKKGNRRKLKFKLVAAQ